MDRCSVTWSKREPAPGEVKSWVGRGTRVRGSKAKVGREGKLLFSAGKGEGSLGVVKE